MQRLMRGQRRPVYLIVDGYPSHRAGVKEYVDSLEGRLKLFFLPPYSWDRNPDELSLNGTKATLSGAPSSKVPRIRSRQAVTLPAEAARSLPELFPGAGDVLRGGIAEDAYVLSGK